MIAMIAAIGNADDLEDIYWSRHTKIFFSVYSQLDGRNTH